MMVALGDESAKARDTRPCGGLAVRLACGVAALTLALGPAAAQMMLPGAVAPTPQGTTVTPKAASAKPKAAAPQGDAAAPVLHGTVVAVPHAATLAGQTLALNGGASQITFAAADKAIVAARVALTGHKLSDSRQSCHVTVPSAPLALTPLGRLNGLERFALAFPACPLAFDVLDGAVVVDHATPACDFQEADCRVEVGGLWGPMPADFGPDRVKALERIRAAAEAAVRSNYKALSASTKDRPTIMGFARDQAQFSSSREETCRDYADEGRHGYCAAMLTQARAARLHDDLVAAIDAKGAPKALHRTGRAAN